MATRIIDFEECDPSYRYYGGDAGRKVGVNWEGSDWLLKFPGPTKELTGSVPSYTSAPLSEFMGSHVYGMLRIPVHDTLLGIREGRLVCACRDFTSDGSTLVDFKSLKNSLSDDETGFTESPSSGRGVILADVRAAIHRIPILKETGGVSQRFWDMFVIDAFIRNIDRNNTNWGILTGGGLPPRLAPVYDNGSSFHNKRTPKAIRQRLDNPDLLRQDALDVRSCYTNDQGKPIAPLKYIRSGQDEQCTQALFRFMDGFDIDELHDLIDDVPRQALGVTVMDDDRRQYYHQVIDYRYRQVFTPMAEHLAETRDQETGAAHMPGTTPGRMEPWNEPDPLPDPAAPTTATFTGHEGPSLV